MMHPLIALLAAASLAVAHVVADQLRFLSGTPRSRWLSIAGGVSVAYVFLHLLPELGAGQEVVAEAAGEALAFLEHHVYLIALLGLAIFYGLDRAAVHSRRQSQAEGEADETEQGVFWLHMASFGVYNTLIGYLLVHREQESMIGFLLFVIAMALHFVVNDYGLREHHKRDYDRSGRWVLVAALFLGYGLGLVFTLAEATIAILVAFLAGGIILNVLKEELPEERASRFSAFALGAGLYAVLLLAL